ncbi:T9SS type A sorting domain-containing protein [Flavobacterium sp.]|jgi:hypothetical protein|uniref:T9SS type A sorting domain-containing protein n=1 Tax=Flavobacterium sp. TaxID=239 RepID=UPI003342923A
MKKITLLLFCLGAFHAFGQQKATGVVNLSTNVRANFLLDSNTSTVTLTMIGPNDRWFGLQFGSFTGTQGMAVGQDLVYWNNTSNVVDARFNGEGFSPITDTTNHWILVSNSNNTPSTGLRTIVCTRALSTGDSSDYTFNFDDTTLDIAWARSSTANYTINNHGGANRGYAIDTPFTNLSTQEIAPVAVSVYPNPSRGAVTVSAAWGIETVSVYTLSGQLIRTLSFSTTENAKEIQVEGLAVGSYLLEIQGEGQKAWKKIIVE